MIRTKEKVLWETPDAGNSHLDVSLCVQFSGMLNAVNPTGTVQKVQARPAGQESQNGSVNIRGAISAFGGC